MNEKEMLVKADHLARMVCKFLRDDVKGDAIPIGHLERRRLNGLASDWLNAYHANKSIHESLKDDLEGYLRAVLEHLAPMLKLYEPNMPEHPVIAAIRDYLEKP